jgi:hypothetical protein
VPRLAIVISAVGSIESLEGTLVSVLENRPADCEIMVALDRPYADPYALAGEVRFVEAGSGCSLVACINRAIEASRAPFVHLLASGCNVREGWTAPALARFGNRRVAAVAPLVMDSSEPARIVAAGLGYSRGGRRILLAHGETAWQPAATATMIGACGFAAFYRRAALELVGGMSPALGFAQADVDLALSFEAAGFSAVIEPDSRVTTSGPVEPIEGAFRAALHEERLFWRNVPRADGTRAVTAHLGVVAVELARHAFGPALLAQVAGRLWACCQLGSYVRRRAWLAQCQSSARPPVRIPRHARLDGSHAAASQVHETRATARSN